jgi:NADH-quinone oxidoreductase subunit G
MQVKGAQVMRVVPFENEAINECWLADRDRFSYEALNAPERLTEPMVKQHGEWQTTDWNTALEYVARSLTQIKKEHGATRIGALGSAHSTVEELHLLAKLVRGLGSENIDYRTRHAQCAAYSSVHWLGTSIESLSTLQCALVVGSFLRKDHPLFAQRIRQSAQKGAQVHSIHALQDDWLMPMAQSMVLTPSAWPHALAQVACAIAAEQGLKAPVESVPVTAAAQVIAKSLLSGERKAVLLGNAAAQHPQAAQLLSLASWIAQHTGASVGYLTEAANTVGAQLVHAMPGPGGLSAAQMLASQPGALPLKACLLLNVEPLFDAANPPAAIAALQSAALVVAFTPFKNAALEVADVLLPIAPFSETSGTFVNAQGLVQSFHGVVKPLGQTRPAWKALRVLGNLLDVPGFEFESSEQVLAQALGDTAELSSRIKPLPLVGADEVLSPLALLTDKALERVADVPIYATDALVRRATSLQRSADAKTPKAGISTAVWEQLRLTPGAAVRITQDSAQGSAVIVLSAELDPTLAPQAVRIPAGHQATASLGAMFGPVAVEKA